MSLRLGKMIILIMELSRAVQVLKTYIDNAVRDDQVIDTYFAQDLSDKIQELTTLIKDEIA
jgi:hypothetical protein